MEKSLDKKYVVVANGTLIDTFGLTVEVKDQVIKQIIRVDNQVRMYGRYVTGDPSHVDAHCLFSSNLNDGHAENDLDAINKYLNRCEKLHKELTFEVYEMSIEYSAHPYFEYEKFEPDMENDS